MTTPVADVWIEWTGGENPAPGKRVKYRLRFGGARLECSSEDLRWTSRDDADPYDIIAYRVVPDVPALTDGPCIYAACDREETITRLEAQASAYKERVEALEAASAFLLSHDEQDAGCTPTDAHLDAQNDLRALLNGADR